MEARAVDTTINTCTRAELGELATMLLDGDDANIIERLGAWRQRVQNVQRISVPASAEYCSICGSRYQQRNPGQHFRTKRHVRAAANSGEYCSLQCSFRQRHDRLTCPPTPAEPHDSKLVIRGSRREFVCRACGGAIQPWQTDQ